VGDSKVLAKHPSPGTKSPGSLYEAPLGLVRQQEFFASLPPHSGGGSQAGRTVLRECEQQKNAASESERALWRRFRLPAPGPGYCYRRGSYQCSCTGLAMQPNGNGLLEYDPTWRCGEKDIACSRKARALNRTIVLIIDQMRFHCKGQKTPSRTSIFKQLGDNPQSFVALTREMTSFRLGLSGLLPCLFLSTMFGVYCTCTPNNTLDLFVTL
jgi:hypothetical protein